MNHSKSKAFCIWTHLVGTKSSAEVARQISAHLPDITVDEALRLQTEFQEMVRHTYELNQELHSGRITKEAAKGALRARYASLGEDAIDELWRYGSWCFSKG